MQQNIRNDRFCTERETILVKLGGANGFHFDEGDRHGRVYQSVRHAVTRLTMDGAAGYLRFDLDTLKAEDITEEFAAEFLTTFKGTPDDKELLPLYVQTSQAWSDWCADYPRNSAARFTQRDHGTQRVVGGSVG